MDPTGIRGAFASSSASFHFQTEARGNISADQFGPVPADREFRTGPRRHRERIGRVAGKDSPGQNIFPFPGEHVSFAVIDGSGEGCGGICFGIHDDHSAAGRELLREDGWRIREIPGQFQEDPAIGRSGPVCSEEKGAGCRVGKRERAVAAGDGSHSAGKFGDEAGLDLG